MRHPQLLIYEHDGRLGRLLQGLAQSRGWSLAGVRQVGACLRALRQGTPTALVLKMGRDLEREAVLLEQVTWQYPEVATVVVGDVDHASLAGLSWDLGARCVLFPPLSRDHLPGVVAGLMGAAVESWKVALGQGPAGSHPGRQAPAEQQGAAPDA
jgi:hypothetical protein